MRSLSRSTAISGEECLNQHRFAELSEARRVIEAWRIEYNTERPHQALVH
jgi:putative transposase